ncbi:hypothetical protein IC620_05215 [Hazenella sp. IB182357]|uniref:Uncharacterized protein n=1 Tax=Polycladospora coralii TaxID=2771432 RepID=A0A926N9B2_9BACL|nr:hypothetical protein [Polycladospora coralii]MBD1371757.1 hypothetical protein [Polycladospora coralii]
MKRILLILLPILIVGGILLLLSSFRQVEELTDQEKRAITRFHQELVRTEKQKTTGIFQKDDFEAISQWVESLHQDDHVHVFGIQFGEELDEAPESVFAQIDARLHKEIYVKDKVFQDFFLILNADLARAKETYQKRESHDILHDLSHFVFTDEVDNTKQWGNTETVQYMKEKGLQMIKNESK